MESWTVIIEIDDPEAGGTEREVYEMTPAPPPGREHAVLVELVTGIHPDAVEASYEDGRAVFRDEGRTIAARFAARPAAAAEPSATQASLFEP